MERRRADEAVRSPRMVIAAAVAGPFAVALLVLFLAAWRLERSAPPPVAVTYPGDFVLTRLVIDPGHGGDNTGTRTFWWRREKDRNLQLALGLKDRLAAGGHWDVRLTRESDVDVPNSQRPAFANENGAEVYLSLHGNGSTELREGFGVIWYAAQQIPESQTLADTVARSLMAAGFPPDRSMGTRFTVPRGPDRAPEYQLTDDLLPVYVRERIDHRMIWPARMPSVLIETHYLTNPVEALCFAFPRTRERFYAALERALVEFVTEMKLEKEKAEPKT